MIATDHNHVALERHGGRELWVHRKGAMSAQQGETGVLPGSMGTLQSPCGRAWLRTSRAAAQLRDAGLTAGTLQGFLARGGQEQFSGDPNCRHLYMVDESRFGQHPPDASVYGEDRAARSCAALSATRASIRASMLAMRHFDHGFAVTSHSSQGLTADRVLVNMDTKVHPELINTRFAYVSVYRASEDVPVSGRSARAYFRRSAIGISTRPPILRSRQAASRYQVIQRALADGENLCSITPTQEKLLIGANFRFLVRIWLRTQRRFHK